MKKINKLLSLLLVLALLVPMLNVASAEEVNPLLLYPLLTEEGKYFNIENSAYTLGGVSDTIKFSEVIDANGNKVNDSATFSVVST